MAGAPSLTALSRRPWATFVWGDSRPVLNRVLFAMVRANDSSPYWLDIRGPANVASEPGPVELGWISQDRLFLTGQPSDARPQHVGGNPQLLTLVSPEEPAPVLASISDFLRLPPIAQEIVSRVERTQTCHVVAIANSDRVRFEYPMNVQGVRRFIDAFLAAPILPFFCATSPPGPGRWAFDFVFEIRANDLTSWREGVLVPEKAPAGTGFPIGQPIPLPSIPEMSRAFRTS